MLSPDTITPDLGIGIALLLMLAIAAYKHHDRVVERREAATAPAELSRLDAAEIAGGRLDGPCLSHNRTCAYEEPHEHGFACDRSCVCWRTAA